MSTISIANDIIPVGKFKIGISKFLAQINKNGNSVIITQNGKPTGVVISPSEYDKLQYTKNFINSISEGLKDSEEGNLLSTSELRMELKRERVGRE